MAIPVFCIAGLYVTVNFPKTKKNVCVRIVQFKGARNVKGELTYVFDGCAKIWGAKI